MIVREFIARYAERQFEWGDDCLTFIADWWQANHGIDPIAKYRGTYATDQQKNRILVLSGGIVRLTARQARRAGANRASAPYREGDFGIVSDRKVGGIFDGEYWVMRSPQGLAFSRDVKVWAAWHI